MKIAIFGLGYVGCVSLGCLAQNGFKVVGVDVNQTKVDLINKGLATIVEKDIDKIIANQQAAGNIEATTDYQKAVTESEVSIICVGTPSTEEGDLNLEYIYKTAEQIGEALKDSTKYHVVAIRSTVMPGTNSKVGEIISTASGRKRGEGFDVVSNPEFLREGSAVEDYYNPPYTLIGGDSEKAINIIKKLYEEVKGEIIQTEIKIAEIIKYVNNSYHALKVTFANEVGNVCKSLGIDSHEVMRLFCKDTQLNISCYYFKPGFAYGGSCLPKDLKAFKTMASKYEIETPVLNSIENSNEAQIKRAEDIVRSKGKKKIAIFGIAFKQGTDDLRYSPIMKVIESLLKDDYQIGVYDQMVNEAFRIGANREYINKYCPYLEELMKNTEAELLEWADVIVLNRKDAHYPVLIKENPDKLFVDLVKVIKDSAPKNYEGICW